MSNSSIIRLLSLVMALVLVVGMIPTAALATEIEDNASETTAVSETVPAETTVVTEPVETEVVETEVVETEPVETEISETEPSETEVVVETDSVDAVTVDTEVANSGDYSSPEIVYDETVGTYYNVISKNDYALAPGITESEIVLNNDEGSHRQVAHVVQIDINNPYTKVMPSYKGMAEGLESKNYGVQVMSEQAAYAEANGYGNVVAAMNLSLSWYNNAYYAEHPELVGEPLGYLIMDGVQYTNSQGQTSGAQTCLVINFDEKDGVARPSDIPKTEIRSTSSAITGWEEQVIPANFGFLVKDGVNQYSENHTSDPASRSFVGIKADGTIIMVMNDGRQSPYSAGFNSYEMAEFMLSLGCVQAVNGDGGGSSCFLSQRPGEELKLNCSPSDGAERETTHGILVISTAPATGEFVRAHIQSDEDYYTPNSTVEFTATGADLVGTAAEIPADAIWQLTDPSMGTIENGVFVSNGTIGDVTVQLVYGGEVVGEDTIHIVMPDTLTFGQATMTVPYGKTVDVALSATYDSKNVVLKVSDVVFELSDHALGTIDGFNFTAAEEGVAVTSGTLSATVGSVTVTANLTLGKGSEVAYNFETAEDQDLSDWTIWTRYPQYGPVGPNGKVKDDEGKYWYNGQNEMGEIEIVTAENGKVHGGEYALAVECDFSQIYETGYHCLILNFPDVDCTDSVQIGFWMYVPQEAFGAEVRFGVGSSYTTSIANGDFVTLEEDGWQYITFDMTEVSDKTWIGIDIGIDDRAANNYDYITETNLAGKYTFYIDDLTIDYSTAVDDREAPVFSDPVVLSTDGETQTALTGQTISYNTVSFETKVVEDTTKTNAVGLDESTAKAYIDGVEVECAYTNGKMAIVDAVLADGVHTIKFSICDKMGNYASVVRQINIDADSGMSTVKVVPHDPEADKILIGSLYWLDVVATDIETIQSVEVVLDLNNVSTWELDHMELAEGFTASYTIDAVENIATIIFARTETTDAIGEAVIASLPARTWESTITQYEGYEDQTPEKLWSRGIIWAQSLIVDIDLGKITFVDDTTGTFSGEEIEVLTEVWFTYYSRKNYEGAVDYYASKTSWHIHTAEAVADQAAGCTADGYTDRTYCAECDSVVDWGTTIPATGHDYQTVDGALKCVNSCGELLNGEMDGKTYIDGVIANGWVQDTYYYVDGVALTGSHFMDGKMYTFDENGVYLPDYLYDGFYEIDGTVMYFISNVYVTGPHQLNGEYYNFDANGKGLDGEVELCGATCLFEDGVSVETDTVILAGLCGENAEYVIFQDGRMIIGGSGDMVDYKSVGAVPWYANHRYDVKSLFIGKDITSVGGRAFYNLYYLESVTFEEGSVLESVDGYGFGMNSKLTEVILPDTVTYIGEPAFRNCVNLEYVHIPAGVTFIGPNAFYLSDNVTLHVAEGSYAESYAISKGIPYTTYEMPAYTLASGTCGETTWDFDSKGVLTISGNGAMADNNTKEAPWEAYRTQIKKVVIGEGVTYIGKFNFYYCNNLTEIEFATNGALKTIGWGAFGYCRALKTVTIPATVETLNGYAFYYCTGLTDVEFEENSKLSTIEQYAFKQDKALKNVYIPDRVTKIGSGAFEGSQETATFYVGEGTYGHSYFANNNIVVREAAAFSIAEGTCGETTWTLDNKGVLTISGNGAMADNNTKEAPWEAYRTQIKKVVIGEGVTYIGKFNFYYCSSMTEIEFATNGALKTIGWGAFGYCRALTTVTIPASVEKLNGYAFYYCTKLTDVNVAEGTKLSTIEQYAFKQDKALKNVYIPDSVTKIGSGAFEGSQETATFYVGEDTYGHSYFANNNIVVREAKPFTIAEGTCGETTWTLDNKGVLTISGNGAMADNNTKAAPWESYRTQIKKVVIGEGVTYIGKFNFYYCSNMTEIEFAENGALKTIGWGAFGYCRALTTVTIPASVEKLDNYSFYYCAKLTTVDFAEGSQLKEIGQYAFKGDTALTSVNYPAGTVIGAGAFLDTPLEG